MGGNSEDMTSEEFFSIDGIFSVKSFSCFRPNSSLMNVQICNDFLVAATGKNMLIRFPVNAPSETFETKIPHQSGDLVYNLFLDPMGWHTIICMQSCMSFYTNPSMKQIKPIHKAKEILIDSVAWNQFNTSQLSTQEILIGSNDGSVYETVLLSDEGRIIATSIEQYWRKVIYLGCSLTSLEVIRFPPGSNSTTVGEPQRCVVLATTPGRMYQFAGWIHSSTAGAGIGGSSSAALLSQMAYASSGVSSEAGGACSSLPVAAVGDGGCTGSALIAQLPSAAPGSSLTSAPTFFHGVFNGDGRLPHGSKFTEFPQNFGYSDLKLYRPPHSELPKNFAWMTGPGVYFGHLKTEQLSLRPYELPSNNAADIIPEGSASTPENMDGQSSDVFAGRVNLTRKTKLLLYPVIPIRERPGHPLGIAMTAFHVVIAYADRIKAINILDEQIVFSMPVSGELGQSPARGICRDPVSGQIWLFGSRGVAQLKVNNETCRIWQIYTNSLQFDEARRLCQHDASKLDFVNMREAEHCFDKGDFMRSARLFAETSVSFEEVALRFSQLSLEHQPLTLRSCYPPILKGLMVTCDEDVINAVDGGEQWDAGSGVENRQEATAGPLPEQEPDRVNDGCGRLREMVDSATPLKVLVATKLDILDRENKKETVTNTTGLSQAGFLSLWLAELLLTEIGFLRDQVATNHQSSSAVDEMRLEAVEQEFKQLLMKPAVWSMLPHTKCLLYNLIESHGANKEFFLLAEMMRDYTRLCDKYMQLGRHSDALAVISCQDSSNEGRIACMYKYATNLAATHPEDVVNTWIRLGTKLDPVKLLPAVMLLPPAQAMRYLNLAVSRLGCSNQAVHHLLLSLCAEASTSSRQAGGDTPPRRRECPLMAYLERVSAGAVNLAALGRQTHCWADDQVAATGDYLAAAEQIDLKSASLVQDALPYDPGFALRTCKEVGHLQGTVFILKLLGMHQQALQAAIDADDICLAKRIAGNDALNPETCRQLWMRLAKHVIGKQNNIQEATVLLRECPLLKLEDILPYFRDFVTVDQFKDSICSSLDSYCDRIDEVKHDMQVAMSCASDLRNRLAELDYRYEELRADSRCLQCGYVLVQHSFYVFPCGHRFHVSCLMELVRPFLTTQLSNGQSSTSPEDPEALLDQLTGSDCVFCGQLAIDSVADLYFPSKEAYEAELAIWK